MRGVVVETRVPVLFDAEGGNSNGAGEYPYGAACRQRLADPARDRRNEVRLPYDGSEPEEAGQLEKDATADPLTPQRIVQHGIARRGQHGHVRLVAERMRG